MIIKDIHIDGFGIYHDFTLPAPLEKGINILYGENESGKSTLLKFLRYTLFGYPSARKLPKMEPLAGGKHGGRIVARTLLGDQVIFERHAATKQGQIQLHYNDIVYNDENMWFRLLGNANEKLFNNIYAFTLDELVDYGSLNDSGMQDRLFSIGIGLNTASIQEIEDNIRTSMDQIYLERGRTKIVNDLLGQIRDKESLLTDLKQKKPLFDEISKELITLDSRAQDLENKIQDIHLRLNKTTKQLEAYPHFINLQQIELALADLPPYKSLPAQWKTDLITAEERIRQNIEEKKIKESKISRFREKYESINPDFKVLKAKPQIADLRDNLNLYSQQVRDYQSKQQEINQTLEEVHEQITQLGTDLSISEITEINAKVIHSKITAFIKQRSEIEDENRIAKARLDAAFEQLSSYSIKWISIVTGLLMLIGAGSLLFYDIPIGASLLAIAAIIVIFAGPKMKSDKKLLIYQKQVSQYGIELQNLDSQISVFVKDTFKTNRDFEPLEALTITGTIEQIQEKIRQIHKIEQESENTKEEIDEYNKNVKQLFINMNLNIPQNGTEVLVQSLLGVLQNESDNQKTKQELQEKIEGLIYDIQVLDTKIRSTQKEIISIFTRVNVETKDDFIKRYEQDLKIKELLNDKSSNITTIETIFGAGKSNEVIKELKATDKTILETENVELETSLKNLKQEQKELLNILGGKRKERDDLLNSSELARLATEVETLKENLRIARQDWLTNRIALDMLQSVKSKYEKEKQPEVIGKAKKYFSKITNGKYPALKVPFGQQEITISDSHKKLKALHTLSRGTKEQLLLSIRLGFIESYEKDAEPLPIVMDEVLVNFDKKRAEKLCEILYDFAQDRQILLFTCHRQTANLFENKNINILNL